MQVSRLLEMARSPFDAASVAAICKHLVLHAHTDLSDGVDTLEVMAQATRSRGCQYFGVADHSKSAHYAGGLSMDEISAVANPYTTILGHMTGRQLLRRPVYEVDVEKILAACAEHGVAVEINANPWRLDLDWRWHQRALDLGCMMSINPDAHSTSGTRPDPLGR